MAKFYDHLAQPDADKRDEVVLTATVYSATDIISPSCVEPHILHA